MAKALPVRDPQILHYHLERDGLLINNNHITLLGRNALKHFTLNMHLIDLDPFNQGKPSPVVVATAMCHEWANTLKCLRLTDTQNKHHERIYEVRISTTTALMCWCAGVITNGHFEKAVGYLETPSPTEKTIRSFKVKGYGLADVTLHIYPDSHLLYHMATYDRDGKIIQ